MNTFHPLQVTIILYADEIVTISPFDHGHRRIIFNPDPSEQELTSHANIIGNIPIEIYTSNKHDDLSSESSSSSSATFSSSSLTSTSSIPAKQSSSTNNGHHLPIDLQFSLPATIILILYCLGHASLYDLMSQFVEFLVKELENQRDVHLGLLATGFLLLRMTGDIWYWSKIVQSFSFYNHYREATRLRLDLANRYTSSSSDYNNCNMLQKFKRNILVRDVNNLKWFKRRAKLKMVLGLVGFYLFYIPCQHFYTETCMWFVSIPRHKIISGLPSLKLTDGINPSPIFRSIVSKGKSPLLSESEMVQWSKRIGVPQLWPDMVLRRERLSFDSCSAVNGTLESFLELEDALYYADEEYLYSILSSQSYYLFFGSSPAYFISARGLLAVSSIVFALTSFLLAKAKVAFFAL
mmetsp:Transcript_4274/g.8177  ORF Transcript_4274/g.8177 Transcript_4274/m.8177 type:complete len:408 (-) Transcript_4274:121-1344(-)